MSQPIDGITIHTKKYFRVILESIDADLETVESFAVKLSTRARVSLPRAMFVASRLPYTVKSGLGQAQANRLKCVLEEIGGKARVEAHLVTPDDTTDRRQDALRGVRSPTDAKETIECPDCGWEERRGATYCSFCHRKFRNPASRLESLEDRLPDENPLDLAPSENSFDWAALVDYVRQHQLRVLIGVIVVLLLVVLLK
jgi:hypothetical protein